MKLERRALILWYARAFCLFVLSFPLMTTGLHKLSHPTLYALAITALLLCIVFSLLFVRYRCIRMVISPASLTLSRGLLIRREITVEFSHICSTKIFATPLSAAFDLVSMVLYCEGFTMVLPVLDARISEELCKAVSESEAAK